MSKEYYLIIYFGDEHPTFESGDVVFLFDGSYKEALHAALVLKSKWDPDNSWKHSGFLASYNTVKL